LKETIPLSSFAPGITGAINPLHCYATHDLSTQKLSRHLRKRLPRRRHRGPAEACSETGENLADD
jgi:hypothetical protein